MKIIQVTTPMRWHRAKRVFYVAIAALIGSASGASARANVLRQILFPRHALEAVAVTDVTSAGKAAATPTAAQPSYFAGISAGYRDLSFGKAGEKPISRTVVDQVVMKALAKQGYLPVLAGRDPDLIISWTWGSLNVWRPDSLNENGAYGVRWRSSTHYGSRGALAFLGANKVGLGRGAFPELELAPGLVSHNSALEDLGSLASDDLYIVVIAAFRYDPTVPAKRAFLWQTRIACSARGFNLPSALPGMVAIAAPFIGRETPAPVWAHATDRFKPVITIGDPIVVEQVENSKPAVSLGREK